MRTFVTATALACVTTTPALAQDRTAEPFTGASVIAIVGVDHSSQLSVDGTGLLYGGAATYDVASGAMRIGAEAEVSDATTSKCERGTAAFYCARAGRDLYAGGRIGAVLSPSTMIYGKAGYTNARVRSTYDLASTVVSPDYAGSGNSDGVRVGAGAEFAIGQLTVRAEYRYSNYSDRYERHQGVVGIGVRF